jgi:hypothetical protein
MSNNKFYKLLRSLSLGKYHTILYNKEIDASYNSSIFGGVLTSIVFLVVATLSAFIFKGVLQKDHYNLDNVSVNFETLEASF